MNITKIGNIYENCTLKPATDELRERRETGACKKYPQHEECSREESLLQTICEIDLGNSLLA